jgi:hypothetical protein
MQTESLARKAILPDGLDEKRLLIVKSCSMLRLTEEIRIANSVAQETQRTFILAVQDRCTLDSELLNFISSTGIVILRISS